MFQFLKTTYGSLFTHREFEFDAIYEKVQFQLSAIIYELRQEIREIVSFHNLTLAGIVYTPVDLVMCRYSYRTPDELDITSLRNVQ